MYSQSLRNKIFMLVASALAGVAVLVMVVSQQTAKTGVFNRERHAVNNVMDLVKQEAESRWAHLLDSKVATVRNIRHQLMQTGSVIDATLESFASLPKSGILTEDRAKQVALAWINNLQLDEGRVAFLFDASQTVLASGNQAMIGKDLSALRDFKGRPLVSSVLRESRDSGDAFALYRSSTTSPNTVVNTDRQPPLPSSLGESHTNADARYAYFAYFRPWNWVVAVTESADDVHNQFRRQRTQMEKSVRETLTPLVLADTGFVYIVTDEGQTVVPPPPTKTDVLDGILADGRRLSEVLRAQPNSAPLKTRVQTSDETWFIDSTYFAPLKWTVVAAVPASDLTAPARGLVQDQAMIFSLMLIVALCCAWIVGGRIVRPLETLTSYARTVPDQAFKLEDETPPHISALSDHRRDEVGRLASAFVYMNSRLRENVQRLMQETTSRERFESELNIARAIQLGLLPIPLSKSEQKQVDLHALMRPAKEVGGDLYDYFTLSNGKLCMVIGDVSDKGVPAALFMAITRTLIRATAEDQTNPAAIVRRVNDRLAENNPNLMFVTLILGVLDMDTGEFCWVNAGHLPPLVVSKDGVVRTLQGRSGPACGVQEDISYITHTARLEPGDALVNYTDGITECLNPQGAHYGEAKLHQTLSLPPVSAAAASCRLLQDVDLFSDAAVQADDITLLIIRRP